MKRKKENMPSPADLHPARRHSRHAGASLLLMTIVLLVASAVFWARHAELDEVTRGQGRVVPSRKTQVVQNLEGGILEELLVREGEVVDAGQPLLRIDATIADAQYQKSRAEYLALLGRIARCRAEAEGLSEPVFAAEVVAEAPAVVANERDLFFIRQRQHRSEGIILDRQIFQRRQELTELEAKRGGLQKSCDLAARELRLSRPLLETGAASEAEVLHLEKILNGLESELETVTLAEPRVRSALKEAMERLDGHGLQYISEALAEVNTLEAKRAGIALVATAEVDRVRRTAVTSPVRGVVKQISFATQGAIIKPGEPIMEITPIEDSLLVEAWVRPQDVAFLRPGLPALVRITAYDFAVYGGLAATLQEISADTFNADGNGSFFRVHLRTRTDSFSVNGHLAPIIPGMIAQVDIITGKKTVFEYLMKPILRARQVALTER